MEGITEIDRKFGHPQNRFRMIGVHMENRRLYHFGDVGTVTGRTRIFRIGGGKANLVVNNNTNRATDTKTTGL